MVDLLKPDNVPTMNVTAVGRLAYAVDRETQERILNMMRASHADNPQDVVAAALLEYERRIIGPTGAKPMPSGRPDHTNSPFYLDSWSDLRDKERG